MSDARLEDVVNLDYGFHKKVFEFFRGDLDRAKGFASSSFLINLWICSGVLVIGLTCSEGCPSSSRDVFISSSNGDGELYAVLCVFS